VPAKLLIADDSTTIQKVFERTFPPTEFTLSFANNGEEALAKLKAERPQVVIADINMPVKNGFELCEGIKNDPALQDIPVLLLVGILEDFDEDESHRVGADGFIVKPFEASAALNKVRDALTKGGAVPPRAQGPGVQPPGGRTGLSGMLEETPSPSLNALFHRQETEDIVELSSVVEEPAAASPSLFSGQGDEGVLVEFADFLKESLPPTPPAKGGGSDILELIDIVQETPSVPTPRPPHATQQEDAFVLQSSLRDLEAELKAEFPEEEPAQGPPLAQAGAQESPLFSETGQEESWSLDLDLPFDSLETEPRSRDADWASLFGKSNMEGPGQEIKDERLGTILGESATELEKIDDLGLTRDKAHRGEEVFAGRFMDGYEPVFETEDASQHINLRASSPRGRSADDTEDLAERVAAAVTREMKTVVEEVIRERVPGLVRQMLEQAKKE
jgi:CheY-like chemotaxis protein